MKLSPVWPLMMLLIGAPASHAQTAPAGGQANVEAAQERPMGAVVGKPIERGDGRWLGLTMVGPKLQLNFYDDHKQPEKADRIRATLRIDPVGRRAERDVMNPTGDGTGLVANKPIRAPWVFVVYITLINEDESAAETLVVDFNRDEADAMTVKAQAEAAAEAAKAKAAK